MTNLLAMGLATGLALSLNTNGVSDSICVSSLQACDLLASQTIAMFAGYTESELVRSSDAILQGEVIAVTQLETKEGESQRVGLIHVTDALKGAGLDGGVVLLGLPQGPEASWPSDVISYQEGQKGLWFLRLRTVGDLNVYWADHPQRFRRGELSSAELRKIRSLMQ